MGEKGCEMKGPLGFMILWITYKESMTGAEMATELEKRKGNRPSPGTIYPVLKDFKDKGFIKANKEGKYTLTAAGKKQLKIGSKHIVQLLYDWEELKAFAKKK